MKMPSKTDFFNVFQQFGLIKEQKMEKEFVDLNELSKKCEVTPYFLMDISSGEMLSVFSAKNIETALRTFKMSVDNFPEILLKDTVLVRYDTREVCFEGKDYIEEWKKQKDAFQARMLAIQGAIK